MGRGVSQHVLLSKLVPSGGAISWTDDNRGTSHLPSEGVNPPTVRRPDAICFPRRVLRWRYYDAFYDKGIPGDHNK